MRAIVIVFLIVSLNSYSQTNISFSNPMAEKILKVEDPWTWPGYHEVDLIHNAYSYCQFKELISADSLRSYLETLTSFQNRNTFSDTTSTEKGIGAARRWIMAKLRSFDYPPNLGSRFEYSYLDFNITNNTCGSGRLRNVIAIRPGYAKDSAITIIEAHMDSRCGGRCDTACVAHGADDNGSGTVMVMELARVLAYANYPGTIVFMLTTGEEQGLLGASALAEWCQQNNVKVKAVLNNDIIGGIFCGETASPPTTCATEGSIDSTRLRVFASSSEQLGSRNQARWIKLNYERFLAHNVAVPMQIQIMNQEDRTGRGGDHIPFRQRGYNATRFTSAVEHGNGAGNSDPNYHDRQHSTDDIIGVDTNGDGKADSLFIDFNYLARNTVVNATMVSLSAIASPAPNFSIDASANGGAKLSIQDEWENKRFLLGVRMAVSSDTTYMFDKLYHFENVKDFTIPGLTQGEAYFISLARVGNNRPIGVWSNGELLVAQASTNDIQEYEMSYAVCDEGFISSPERKHGLDFELQPNPASDQLTLGAKGIGAFDYWEVRLRDIRGRNVFSKSLMGATRFSINTQYIESGVYLVQFIHKGDVVHNEKLVISH